IFGRLAEIIIQRLNQVPDKNFRAYMNLLGVSLLPPQPARVPLTFTLAAGSNSNAIVPVSTQVAAPPGAGESQPVIFETERELVVTAAQLSSLFVRNPERDTYGDHSALINSNASSEALIFQGDTQVEHIFYFSQDRLLGSLGLTKLDLTLTLLQNLGDNASVLWQIWNGLAWETRLPSETVAGSLNLRVTGANKLSFNFTQPVPQSTVNGAEHRWLRCCLLTPITPATDALENGMVRAALLPVVDDMSMQATVLRQNVTLDAAFINNLPLDTTKQFFPFGDRPKFGDTLYLASTDGFSQAGSFVALDIPVSNPSTANPQTTPIPPTYAANKPQLQWEFWNGSNWVLLGTAVQTGVTMIPSTDPNRPLFKDTTLAFTVNGTVSFTLPAQPAATVINGVQNFWVRARLVSGNYGVEAHYVAGGDSGYTLVASTLQPPAINQLTSTYNVKLSATPDAIWSFNNQSYQDVTSSNSFSPFKPATESVPTLYLGFTLPLNQNKFPNRNLTLYNGVALTTYGEKFAPLWPTQSKASGDPNTMVVHSFSLINDSDQLVQFIVNVLGVSWSIDYSDTEVTLNAGESATVEVMVTIPSNAEPGDSDSGFLRVFNASAPLIVYDARFKTYAVAETPTNEQLRLDWEYWNGTRWSRLTVVDDSESFTRSGLVEFVAPPDFASHSEFGLPAQYWLRVSWSGGEYELDPRLNRVLLNTTMATQTVTIKNEVLGSSDGSANQFFRTTRTPILAGQQLQVREQEMPSVDELSIIENEEGMDAVSVSSSANDGQKQVWVRWHEVPDFYGSGPRDRHYVLDHLTGMVFFGNGSEGLIPSIGAGNLRLVQYRTGQGISGNRPPGSITQLKTTVPYIEKVTNVEAATGGAEAETMDSLLERAPRTIRHRNRAVTPEDYEDLGRLATPEVARTKCVPLYDLASDPDATARLLGTVSLIIVPRSIEAKPLPSLELISQVQDYIEARQIPTAKLIVVGPEYIRVDVEVEVGLSSIEGASGVTAAISDALSRYLHPLNGGLNGLGWNFGRKPHTSDLYVVLEAVPGVDYVKTLNFIEVEDRTGAGQTGRFLVYSGTHTITVTYEED
ncbi:MAG TPA: putative baseplate assembly protein, partial [Pyrinomonadaceae bacterium]|nr:putative baseplate assembly protein [Pyrinomonadaceae bacterium]